MRSRPSHAAKSGVGEHTARESESAQRMRRERACGERPPPNLALEPQGSGALFFLFFGRPPAPKNNRVFVRVQRTKTGAPPKAMASEGRAGPLGPPTKRVTAEMASAPERSEGVSRGGRPTGAEANIGRGGPNGPAPPWNPSLQSSQRLFCLLTSTSRRTFTLFF